MSEIKIKCPTCGKILRLNETPNINASSFTCPVCKEKHVVGNCQRYVPPTTDDTRYGSNGATQPDDDKTRIGPQSGSGDGDKTLIGTAPQAKVGMLVDANGTAYQLAVGYNTIGRKASTSPASVQIATADRTMSRDHAVIEVRNAGGQLLHLLKNGANMNPSYLNNALIAPGDQLILNNGDRITMGKTILTFKK